MSQKEGKVIRSVGGLFEVLCDPYESEERVLCRARGVLRRDDRRVLVGDRVTVTAEGEEAVIEAVAPRKNSLIRPPLANLDCLYAVLAVTDPAPQPETTDKLLAIMEHEGIDCHVVLTKTDLSTAEADCLAALYRAAGYTVFLTSPRTGAGVDKLREHLRATLAGGATAVFSGASGVGKTSLLNALFPSLSLKTGEISRKIARGKNTTRHTELYTVFGPSGGFLGDTPGFSMLDFLRFDFMGLADLPHAFREFSPYLGACRYGDCNHIKEEECALRAALAEGKIAESRYQSYVALHEVLRTKKTYGGEK